MTCQRLKKTVFGGHDAAVGWVNSKCQSAVRHVDVVSDMSGWWRRGEKSLLRLDLKTWSTSMFPTCNNEFVQRRLGKNAHMIALESQSSKASSTPVEKSQGKSYS